MSKTTDITLKYSFESFMYDLIRTLNQELETMQEVTSSNKNTIIKKICSISEALIWGEQNQLNFFE
jgi:hypothetical protein